MKFSPEKIKAVMALAAPDRYSHFIKVAADQRSVWGLYKDGWALLSDSDSVQYLPLWPAAPYANQCADAGWEGYAPREIDLDDLFETVLPQLKSDSTGLAIFPTASNKGIALQSFETVEADLRSELARVE